MDAKTRRVIIAHAGSRDNYQLALAFSKVNYLEKLVTDFYTSNRLRNTHSIFKRRYCNGVSSKDTINLYKTLLTGKNYPMKDKMLSLKAYSLATKTNANLYLYSYYAYHAFRKAITNQYDGKRILFQLHPHPQYIKIFLQTELERTPEGKVSLCNEHEMKYDQALVRRLSEESSMADEIIVASSFTKKTLIAQGISDQKIKVIPYGVNLDAFSEVEPVRQSSKLSIVFIGQMIQRKGLSYLFKAIKLVGYQHINLTLCGRGFIDKQLLKFYADIPVDIKINLTTPELVKEIQRSDVLIFPSLIEGFAHVILEAMACGKPVITTENTCAPDIIENGKEGFIVPIRDEYEIANRINWCLNNRKELAYMGKVAAQTASLFTWQRFRNEIIHHYDSMFGQ